jgi:membrane-associated phospholipid phosphatase
MTRHLSSRPSRSAVLARAAAALGRRFGEGRAWLAEGRWERWWRHLGVGAVLLVVWMVALRLVAEQVVDSGMLAGEPAFLEGLAARLSLNGAIFLQTFGSDITLLILVPAATAAAVWARRPITALTIVAAVVGADLVVRFGWLIWDRARPTVLYEGIASPGFHSFPSGHAAKTAAVYGILVVLWVRASGSAVERIAALGMLGVILMAVGAGRLGMGAHWPSDVAGGYLVGLFWVAWLARGLRCERGEAEPAA